ncbi:MAG: guanylate kinase [Candidatus Omnitrophota bacterium]
MVVLSAPSGGGKTTLCRRLIRAVPAFVRSVSVTTRRPRPGERDGKDYFFISRGEFLRLRKNKKLLEWTRYDHAYYGTPLDPLKQTLRKGKTVLLLLDGRGAREVKRHFKSAKTIFLLPPTMKDLRKRLVARKTERRSALMRRLHLAKMEIAQARRYDFTVVNDDLHQAFCALCQILCGNRK